MLFTKHGLFISCFCVIVLSELTAANLVSNLNWICEESAPCIRAIRPHGGVGEVSESTDRYTLLIGVHRRQTAEEDVMNGWSDGGAEPTWNVDVRWFRFLETRMRVLLPTCRNKLSCDVRLLGKNDVESDSETTHVFSHFIVEVRFDGHPSITRLKLVVRRNFGGNKKESKEGDGDDDFDSMLSANRGPKDPIKNKPQVTRPSPNVVVGNDGIYKPALTDEKPRISSPELNEEIKSHPNYGAMFNTGDTSDEKAGETGLSFHIQKDETDDYTNIIEWKGSKPNNSTNDNFDDDYDNYSWDSLDYQQLANANSTFSGAAGLLGPTYVVIIVLSSFALVAFAVTCCCCCIKRQRKQRRESVDSNSIKVGSKSRWKRWFFWRVRRKRRDYQPVPSQGIRRNSRKMSKGEYSNLPSDSDDEDYSATVRDRSFEELKNTSKEMSDKASEAFAFTRRRSSVVAEKVTEAASGTYSWLVKVFRFLRTCIVAWVIKCCVGQQLDKKDYESSDDGGPSTSKGIRVIPPSSGLTDSSFVPSTDISGRFPTTSYENASPGNSKDEGVKESTKYDGPLPHNPHPSCGLHCLQRADVNIVHSATAPLGAKATDNASVASGDCRPVTSSSSLTSSTSVTSFSSSGVSSSKRSVRSTRNNMSHGDATTNPNRPQLPNIISRTKESYRRENQRMSTLLRRWEKRSSSCVIVDETKHRTRADFPCRRSLSVNGRFLDAGDHPSTSRCPPNLPLRRKRLPRSLLTPFLRESHRESAKRESAGDSGRSSHGARLDKRRVQRRKLAITAEKRRGGTPKGSECEDVITKSRNESKTRKVTNADKNDDQKSESASHPEASTSRANVAAEPCDALSRTQHLQYVANAFLTSDDENLYSADEGYDHFWKHDNT